MTAIATGYRVVLDEQPDLLRIIAVDGNDVEIVGAYRTRDLNAWMLYLTKQFAAVTGLPQPNKVHVISREDAAQWVDQLAALYTRAVTR